VGNNATVLNSASAPWVSEHRPAEFLGQKQNCTRVVDAASGDDEAARRQSAGVPTSGSSNGRLQCTGPGSAPAVAHQVRRASARHEKRFDVAGTGASTDSRTDDP